MKKAVEIRALNFIYPDGIKALNNINLDIHEGESLAIVGSNGAGKSTLLLHLNGLLGGEDMVKVLDRAVNKDNLKFIRSQIGFVFQDPHDQLFMPTVYDDVAFGPVNKGLSKDKIDSLVKLALEKVDMLGSAKRISHHLSFGEQKRVSIATVLSMDPKVLVLDEPSSNLDPKHRRDLIKLLKNIEITKIIATHDLDLVLEVCGRVVILDKGEIAADGNALGILSNKNLLEKHGLELPLSLQQNQHLVPK